MKVPHNAGNSSQEDHASLDTLLATLKNDGYRVFVLPPGITDRIGFFEGVRDTLPLDPPLVGSHNPESLKWEALADSLWEGIYGLHEERIALIWPDAGRMATQEPEDFVVAHSVLDDVSKQLADVDATLGSTKEFLPVLMGLGENDSNVR